MTLKRMHLIIRAREQVFSTAIRTRGTDLCEAIITLSLVAPVGYFRCMSIIDDILNLEAALEDLAKRRDACAQQPSKWDELDQAYRAADRERLELLAGLSPEDEQWLDVERATIRHGAARDLQD